MFKKLALVAISLALSASAFAQEAKDPCKGIYSLRCSKPNAVVGTTAFLTGGAAAVETRATLATLEQYRSSLVVQLSEDGAPAEARSIIRHAAKDDAISLMVRDLTTGKENLVTFPKQEAAAIVRILDNKQYRILSIKRVGPTELKRLAGLSRKVRIGSVIALVAGAVAVNELYKANKESQIATQESALDVEMYESSLPKPVATE